MWKTRGLVVLDGHRDGDGVYDRARAIVTLSFIRSFRYWTRHGWGFCKVLRMRGGCRLMSPEDSIPPINHRFIIATAYRVLRSNYLLADHKQRQQCPCFAPSVLKYHSPAAESRSEEDSAQCLLRPWRTLFGRRYTTTPPPPQSPRQ